MSELHASLGIVQMSSAESVVETNNSTVKYYTDNIKNDRLTFPYNSDTIYSGYKFIAIVKDQYNQEELAKYLYERGIKVGKNVYDIPIHMQPALKNNLNTQSFPESEQFAKQHICLPIWKGLTSAEIKTVVEAVNQWK